MTNRRTQFYTAVMAQLLMEWRISQGLSRYHIAMATGMNQNTVKRFEEGLGGVSFEDGFRYVMYAESHKSKPNIMRKFREAIAACQDEEEQERLVKARQKQTAYGQWQRQSELLAVATETREAVQKEMAELHTSETTRLEAEKAELAALLQSERDRITAMEKDQQVTTEQHKKELEEAKRKGAEEAQQEFRNKSFLERIKG